MRHHSGIVVALVFVLLLAPATVFSDTPDRLGHVRGDGLLDDTDKDRQHTLNLESQKEWRVAVCLDKLAELADGGRRQLVDHPGLSHVTLCDLEKRGYVNKTVTWWCPSGGTILFQRFNRLSDPFPELPEDLERKELTGQDYFMVSCRFHKNNKIVVSLSGEELRSGQE